jgi:hypothetical protein
LVCNPVSMRSASTRVALVFRVRAMARTRLATRGVSETLWRMEAGVRLMSNDTPDCTVLHRRERTARKLQVSRLSVSTGRMSAGAGTR